MIYQSILYNDIHIILPIGIRKNIKKKFLNETFYFTLPCKSVVNSVRDIEQNKKKNIFCQKLPDPPFKLH